MDAWRKRTALISGAALWRPQHFMGQKFFLLTEKFVYKVKAPNFMIRLVTRYNIIYNENLYSAHSFNGFSTDVTLCSTPMQLLELEHFTNVRFHPPDRTIQH
jgi:hypothetical protein